MVTLPPLPLELHAEIRNALHHHRDRSTLLSASLVNKEWSKGSQRILFSEMTYCWYDSENGKEDAKNRVESKHIRFLQTIIEQPQRLGPLVKSYSQDCLAFNPAAMRNPELCGSGAELWKLTERALPVMVNLKYLYLAPHSECIPAADGWASSSALLSTLTFQLESLTWKNSYNPDTGLSKFLKIQENLRHLETLVDHDDDISQWLDSSLCPTLVSGSGSAKTLRHIARSRSIVAWKWLTHTKDRADRQVMPQDSLVLDRLLYLDVDNYKSFRHDTGAIDLKIILLVLGQGTWDQKTLKSLSKMPRLRVLVLHRSTPGLFDILARIQRCFKRLPSLEYIIYRSLRDNGEGYRYVKITICPNAAGDLLEEEMEIDSDGGAAWWAVYNV